MAGRNQHNIPQTLLRGFRVPGGSKKESKTWLYEKGVAPHLELIKDEIAVERHFYSEPSVDGSRTLDDEITGYETHFGQRLHTLKSAPVGAAVDAETAAEIVAHLTIRNAHLRRTFAGGVRTLLDRAVEVFCNEEILRPILGLDLETPSDRLKTQIDECLKENPALASTGLPAHVFYKVAHTILKEQFRTVFAEQAPFMTMLFDTLAVQAPEFIRDGHNTALSSGLAPDGRTEVLKKLDWRVSPCPHGGFVLPDCVALAVDDKSGLKPLILADPKEVTAVLVPLSTDRMLVGCRQSATVPALEEFNEAAAVASHSFFIAARLEEPLTTLADRIGESSGRFIDDTVGSTFNEFLAKRNPALTTVTAAPNSDELATDVATTEVKHEQTPVPPPRYTVHFLGCADEPTAGKIAAALHAVTESLVQWMPLDRLDGVTFASDYPAALRDLERGFPATQPLQPTAEGYGVGVAMAPLVVRDGVCKTHIVMWGEIGHSLINEDESIWRTALHVVVDQLAHAACTQTLDESLPGVLLKRIDDPYDGFLYACIHSAWTGYFTARASAPINPEGGRAQQELLLSVLKRARNDIPEARLAYRFHGDMDKFLEVVMPRIADILRFSGSVLGHYTGVEKPYDPALIVALEEMGLRDWFVLFNSELSGLWDRRGKWSSFNEFLMLNRHVERLFWLFGLFPWKADDERIYVSVPLASDAGKLAAPQASL